MQRWEHRAVACLASLEAVSAAVDRMEPDGWRLADHFDTSMEVPDVPPGLADDVAGRKSAGEGAVLLAVAAQRTKRVPGHVLIFVRPALAPVEEAPPP